MSSGTNVQEFEKAILPHLDAAYNLARWMLRREADAQDVVQEAFVRALGAFDSFRGLEARAWLLTIVRNTALTKLRKEKSTEAQPLHDGIAEREGQASDPQAELVRAANVQSVRQAVESLPADLREVVVLREMEQMSYRQIASVAGIPIGTVMSRLSRARDQLRQIMAGSQT